jgi:hypothetical protein
MIIPRRLRVGSSSGSGGSIVILLRTVVFLLSRGGGIPNNGARGFVANPKTTARATAFLAGTGRPLGLVIGPAVDLTGARRQKGWEGAMFSSTSASSTDSTASSTARVLADPQNMRAADIKKELESYGIGTKSFLEKSELVNALVDARSRGLRPRQQQQVSTSTSASPSSPPPTGSPKARDGRSREERIAEEMAKCRSMKASELKQELKDRGVPNGSFLEKSDFVRAVAEARVDGVVAQRGSSSSSSSSEEGYAEYKNVEVLTDDASGPRKKQEDVSVSSGSRAGSPFGRAGTSPFGGMGGGSPFGGVGSPFGGSAVGGMGGIADMLKNMRVGGGAAAGGTSPFGVANPFGGGAASPFGGGASPFGGMGDVMGKAQELMTNPKVREIMVKAQANPRIMAKVNECMSNPASFAKYQNDPEVAELISELRKYM